MASTAVQVMLGKKLTDVWTALQVMRTLRVKD